MRLPRDVSDDEPAKNLKKLRRRNHTANRKPPSPNHDKKGANTTSRFRATVKLGTLAGIIGDVSQHFVLSKDEVITRLFKK